MIELRMGVRRYKRRRPPLPEGYEYDPQDDYVIRPILADCVDRQKYQPTNSCCAGERNRCKRTGKDVNYFVCRCCLESGNSPKRQ